MVAGQSVGEVWACALPLTCLSINWLFEGQPLSTEAFDVQTVIARAAISKRQSRSSVRGQVSKATLLFLPT